MTAASFGFWRSSREQRDFRRRFIGKLAGVAALIPFAEDLLTAYYCAFDRQTPLSVKTALIGALAYFVLPTDAIPDFLPLVGFTDDAAVLAAAIKLVTDHIRPEHREAARRRLAGLAASNA
ncbi:MAG TPA: YkvA family protein [Pseudolabrys sp.]|nr:YkvA family protein [Pseudolabrys sp.]